MSIYLETERLIIREVQEQDAAGMFELDADPEVQRYVGQKPISTIAQARETIDFIRQQYVDPGICRWAVIEKATNAFIGWTGFKLIKESINGHTDYYDFGYRFIQRKWGQGFAFEASRAALDYGVQQLSFQDIYATTDVDNTGSRRLLEKLGFRFVELFRYDGAPTWREPGQETTWYELDAASIA